MDNGRITGGSVSFTKRRQPAQYEPIEATTKLDFSVEEGADFAPVLALAEAEVQNSVLAMVGLQPRPLASTPPAPRSRGKAGPSAPTAESPSATGTSAPPAQVADDPLAPAATAPTSPTPSASSTAVDDPLAPTAAAASAPATQPASPAASVASAGAVDDPLAPTAGASAPTASTPSTAAAMPDDQFTAQREVTDADLMAAAAKKNEALVKLYKEAGTAKIRDLIGKFLPPGKQLRELAAAQRPTFVSQLDALA